MVRAVCDRTVLEPTAGVYYGDYLSFAPPLGLGSSLELMDDDAFEEHLRRLREKHEQAKFESGL